MKNSNETDIEKDVDEIQNVDVPIIKENVSIFSKTVNSVKSLGGTIWSMRITSEAMKYITWYAGVLVAACSLYLVGWCIDWYVTKTPKLDQLLQFIHEIVSSPYVAVIGFIAKAFTDKNHNGKSDLFEDDTQDNDSTTTANPIQENNNTTPPPGLNRK